MLRFAGSHRVATTARLSCPIPLSVPAASSLSTYLSTGLGCFQVLAVLSGAIVKIRVRGFFKLLFCPDTFPGVELQDQMTLLLSVF